ncbi:MAG: ATP-binding protein [Cytophagaceae bacterium]
MSDQEKQEDLLKEDAEDLYQNAPCGYISFLPDRTIAKINDVLLNWLGYDREDLLYKKKFTDLVTVGGKIYYETHHDPLQRMQGFVNELSYDLVRKDGTTIPCLLNSKIRKDGNGNILLIRTTIFDITERKKYEKELLRAKKEAEKAAKSKAQLLSVMSHEIRTPMNAIIGLSHLLLEENPKQEQIENLKILKVSAENLLNLLNSILDYSKIEAGKVVIDETDFSLQELVSGIVNTFKIKAAEKGIALNLEYDQAIPAVLKGDPVKIGQILTNLIGNGIKFTNKGYVKIKIEFLYQENQQAVISFTVKDTGVGIAADKLPGIFNEFEQAGAEIAREFGGTGLGLSISKKLIEIMGSKINVESQLGKGTEFNFTLKLRISDNVLLRDAWGSNEIKAKSLKGIKVLLAEDNSVNVLVITKFLRNWQVEFDVASDGKEAYDKVIAVNYDLVLMDLQMPVMTGYETTEKIRSLEDPKYQQLPIIALTASAIIGENHKIFRIGMNDFVSKPFNPKELYDKIYKYANKATNEDSGFQSEVMAHANNIASLLNYDKYKLLSEGDNEFLKDLTVETIQNFENYRIEFAKAIKELNLDAYKKQMHKIKMVTDLLELKGLEDLLKSGERLIETNNNIQSKNFATSLDTYLLSIINELNNQLQGIKTLA